LERREFFNGQANLQPGDCLWAKPLPSELCITCQKGENK
jgi:hypothetical protein